MPLHPDRRLQLRIACALALVVGVNAVVLLILGWSIHHGLSANDHAVHVDLGLPFTVGAVLVGTLGLVAVQARYGSRSAISGLETEPIDGDGPRNIGPRVRRLAAQADVPAPSVAVADRADANCLTVGTQRSPTVVVTTGLLERLDDDELEAALAHEIAHLANRDLTVVSAIAAIVAAGDRLLARERSLRRLLVTLTAFVRSFGPLLLMPGAAVFVVLPLLLFSAPIFVVTALVLVVSPVARLLLGVNAIILGLFAKTREYAADRGAIRLVGDPAALVSALETLDGIERPKRDPRLDASATLGIVPRPLSIDRPDGDDETGWFERWFVDPFDKWKANVSDGLTPDQQSSHWQSRDRSSGADDERKSWVIEPFVATVVAPIRSALGSLKRWTVTPIRSGVRRLLTWRPATHPSTEARIDQLRRLEQQRRR